MSRVRKADWEIAERRIFLILFEEEKCYFINDSKQKSIWDYYDSHYRERNSCTKKLFADRKKLDASLPPMFCLDTVVGNTNDAFQVKLAWSLYFKNHGYQTLMGKEMRCIVNGFAEYGSEYYEQIKDRTMSEVCAPEKNLAAEFRNSSKLKRTETTRLDPNVHRISIQVREKDYQKIKEKAAEYGISMSQYIEECVHLGGILIIDTAFLEQYIRELLSTQKLLKGLLATYLVRGNYLPADMQRLQEICDQVTANCGAVMEEIGRLCRRLRRMKDGEL